MCDKENILSAQQANGQAIDVALAAFKGTLIHSSGQAGFAVLDAV